MITRTLAEIYARQGHIEEAADIYRRLLAKSPDDGTLRARLAELEGDLSDARGESHRDARIERLRALLRRVNARRR
ncbi:MAG: hypothetical protein CVU56_02765 [Deltaproteobacteria bacterium HGW-Deltaproteobacteria-14]|jgi:tetratricopeptide (TPR) repeat protein|nr:MAG: hypothetical protein CVU56_02765 [Deltaproteobacteria bacterium HGW-Deltaproteobacteria-14]